MFLCSCVWCVMLACIGACRAALFHALCCQLHVSDAHDWIAVYTCAFAVMLPVRCVYIVAYTSAMHGMAITTLALQKFLSVQGQHILYVSYPVVDWLCHCGETDDMSVLLDEHGHTCVCGDQAGALSHLTVNGSQQCIAML